MGQYYMTAFMHKDGNIEVMHPHHYDNGLKLMEHSWVGNNYVNTVIQHLMDITNIEGGCRMAHVGDYSNDLICEMAGKKKIARKMYSACWGGGYQKHYITPQTTIPKDVFIVNDDRKEYIRAIQTCDEGKDWIASFTLLIAMGNGLGGGDYRGRNEGLVGRWACDHLRATEFEPQDCLKIHGWEFKEEY
jgi:hypothetical protein